MGNSQSKQAPYYKTAAVSGAAGGVLGAAAVCAFIFSLPISVSAVVIGGTVGCAASVVTEHVWPSQSQFGACLKGGTVGFIAGGSTYYMAVKVAPDVVLSSKQLSVIQKRAAKVVMGDPSIKPTKIVWKKGSSTYSKIYKIKDAKTSYVVKVAKRCNALKITEKANRVSSLKHISIVSPIVTPLLGPAAPLARPILHEVGRKADLNHVHLEISDGTNTFITELTGPIKEARGYSGGVIVDGTREGTLLHTYYVDPNKCRSLTEAKRLITEAKVPWDKSLVYNTGDATCQHYAQDMVHVLTNKPKAEIPLKEKNTFAWIQKSNAATGGVFDLNSSIYRSQNVHQEKDALLQNLPGSPPSLAGHISNAGVGGSYAETGVVAVAVTATAGYVSYRAIQKKQEEPILQENE